MHICNHCKYSNLVSVPDTPCYIAECKKHFTIDPVSGFKQYTNCEYKNPNGNCQEYEETWFRKFINKLF